MTQPDRSVPGPAAAVGPMAMVVPPIESLQRRWPLVLGGLLSAAMVAGLARELLGGGLDGLARAMPADPRFYLVFGLLYLAPPLGDFAIFRGLWRIPPAGLAALLRKRIANDVVIGYSGEAYFYAWARARAGLVAAPFGAVKDVSILSAVAGNAVTLAIVAVALPFAAGLLTPGQFRAAIGSAGLVVLASLPLLLFRRRVFSLPAGQLWWVFGVHCLRLVAGSLLLALAWHLALPGVAVRLWLVLAAVRLLVSRLPLLPNKDLLFANLAILLIGAGQPVSELIAFIAAATLVVHGLLVAGLGVHGLADGLRRRG